MKFRLDLFQTFPETLKNSCWVTLLLKFTAGHQPHCIL